MIVQRIMGSVGSSSYKKPSILPFYVDTARNCLQILLNLHMHSWFLDNKVLPDFIHLVLG